MEELEKYIIDYFITTLTMPTVREIALNFSWASTNAVWKKLKVLESCGIICKHLGKYTLNPSVFRFHLERPENPDDSEYWRQKNAYFERVKEKGL